MSRLCREIRYKGHIAPPDKQAPRAAETIRRAGDLTYGIIPVDSLLYKHDVYKHDVYKHDVYKHDVYM